MENFELWKKTRDEKAWVSYMALKSLRDFMDKENPAGDYRTKNRQPVAVSY